MTAERMFGLTEEQKSDVIIAAAARLQLPAIYSFGFYIESGEPRTGSIRPNWCERPRPTSTASCAGQSRLNLPVQLPTKYRLVINAKTAAALGLVIPTSMQLLADSVIE
jgi:putative ABC transport system substrate-binding protein